MGTKAPKSKPATSRPLGPWRIYNGCAKVVSAPAPGRGARARPRGAARGPRGATGCGDPAFHKKGLHSGRASIFHIYTDQSSLPRLLLNLLVLPQP